MSTIESVNEYVRELNESSDSSIQYRAPYRVEAHKEVLVVLDNEDCWVTTFDLPS